MTTRALLIGINYEGSSCSLKGCVNDILSTKDKLVRIYGYDPKNIVIMEEHSFDPKLIPTKDNMLTQIKKFVGNKQMNVNARLTFHFSGHGGGINDFSGDEDDVKDECIYPLDFTKKDKVYDPKTGRTTSQLRCITDDDLDLLFDNEFFDQTTKVRRIFDCCHSGTMGDQKVNISFANKKTRCVSSSNNNKDVSFFNIRDVGEVNVTAWDYKENRYRLAKKSDCVERFYNSNEVNYLLYIIVNYSSSPVIQTFNVVTSSPITASPNEEATKDIKLSSKQDVIIKIDPHYEDKIYDMIDISGCLDNQESADAFINGKPKGACTDSLWKVMEKNNYNQTILELCNNLNIALQNGGYEQSPKLSLGQYVDVKKTKISF